MGNFYGDRHRELQSRFGTRELADRLEEMIIKEFLDDRDQAFVSSRDMFYLSTIDHDGFPTVSYKGGDPGFIRVLDERTIAFPSYDGNGMFLSMGNLIGNPNVGLLFIDLEHPHRLRLQGSASVSADDPLLAEYGEADLVVRIAIRQTWVNCPRYVHRHQKLGASEHVPRAEGETPLAEWKRLDVFQDVLPPKDRGRPEREGGIIAITDYTGQADED